MFGALYMYISAIESALDAHFFIFATLDIEALKGEKEWEKEGLQVSFDPFWYVLHSALYSCFVDAVGLSGFAFGKQII